MIGEKVTVTTTDQRAGLMDRYCGEDGKEWIYVQANGAIDQYDAVAITEAGQAVAATDALVDDGHKIGVAQLAFADNEYGYVQIRGVCELNVKASCAADVFLYTSATAGHLDDTATSLAKIAGIVCTEAGGTGDGPAAAFMATEPVLIAVG